MLHKGTSLKYITTAISMSDGSLAELTGFKLSGNIRRLSTTVQSSHQSVGKKREICPGGRNDLCPCVMKEQPCSAVDV